MFAAVAYDDPRIDPLAQRTFDGLRARDYYGGDEGRRRWRKEGKRAEWIVRFARAVRSVAPAYGLAPSPTDLFVTAHAAISTGFGRSALMRSANNAFGIKGNNAKQWPGPVVRSTRRRDDGTPYHILWRVYPTEEAAISDMLRIVTDPRLRYRKSGALLRQGDLGYMAQLGRDGWYGSPPEEISARWRGTMPTIEKALAEAPPEPRRAAQLVPALLLLGLAGGLAYLVWRDLRKS
jgi:hypothetical protein